MYRWLMALFDWNGTLIDDVRIVYKSVEEIFKTYGLKPPSVETYRNEIVANFMQFYSKYGIPEYATKEDLNKIRKRVLMEYWDSAKLHDNAVATIKELKRQGLKIRIVSGEVPEILEKRLKTFGIKYLFDVVKGGAWGHKEKALSETLKEFNLNPEQAFYVDDTFDGIGAAKNTGLATFGWTKGYHSLKLIKNAKPDFIISSMNELRNIILKNPR